MTSIHSFENIGIYHEELEQALLSILLNKNSCLDKITDFLKPEHFYNKIHSDIYEAILTFNIKGMIADPVTLSPFFQSNKKIDPDYLFQLGSIPCFYVNAESYARTVFDAYVRRSLIDIGENIIKSANTFDIEKKDSQEQIDEAEGKLFSLSEKGTTKTFIQFSVAINNVLVSTENAFRNGTGITGISTGLIDLDYKLGGFHNTDLIIVAGRPSMGKTAFATNIAFSMAKDFQVSNGKRGARVAFFSLEMSSDQLALRIISQESKISSHLIRQGKLDHKSFQNMIETARSLNDIPLFIDETPGITINAIRSKIRMMVKKEKISAVFIDYIQLIGSDKKRFENRVQEVSEITRGLKGIAKEFNVPVIALSQLSRSVEQREDKRPMLSDLRESGSIEQDSDVVMFVYREEYYESRQSKKTDEGFKYLPIAKNDYQNSENKNIATIIISKQRHGPIGDVSLQFQPEFTKFSNLTRS